MLCIFLRFSLKNSLNLVKYNFLFKAILVNKFNFDILKNKNTLCKTQESIYKVFLLTL